VRGYRARDERLGVIAVDPSSSRTGGALLGDRFRVRSAARDPGVFFRSMAARERLGGLAEATRAGVTVLGAAFERVLVETVGVGQSESDVAGLVDTLVYVAQPGAGDMIQFMKAGVLELPDVFVVNKADLGAVAERTASELKAGLGLAEHEVSGGWVPPVVLVSARDGSGVEALLQAIDRHRESIEVSGALAARRKRGRDRFVRESLRSRYGSHGIAALGGEPVLEERLAGEQASGFELAAELGDAIEAKLGAPAAGGGSGAARAGGLALRTILLALLFSLLFGFVLGTVLRHRLEKPAQYLGARPAPRSAPAVAADPGNVGHAGPGVLEPRQHEQQVG
jgi:LAO/AO transport system kinase